MKKLFLLLCLALIVTPRAHAQLAVYDPVNFVENYITAIESTLTEGESEQQTLQLIAQLQQLVGIWDQAKQAYTNFGDEVNKLKELQNANWGATLLGGQITWGNLGRTVRTWNNKQNESSPLAQLNLGLFGVQRGNGFNADGSSSATNMTQMNQLLQSNTSAAGEVSRDQFLAGVFSNAKPSDIAGMSKSTKTSGFVDNAYATNASLALELSRVDADLEASRNGQDALAISSTTPSDADLQQKIAKSVQISNDLAARNIELNEHMAAAKIANDNAANALAEEQLQQEREKNIANAIENNAGGRN